MGSFLPSLGIGNGRNLEGCFLCSVHFFFFFYECYCGWQERERGSDLCGALYGLIWE